MKAKAQMGLGLHVRQALTISVEKEEILWQKGLLGSGEKKVLLDTMVFLIGLNFALRSGLEHRGLTRDQLCVLEDECGKYLQYTEKLSKNNTRGLKDCKVERKICKAYCHLDNPDHCVVALYEKYLAMGPKELDENYPFYLTPLRKTRPEQWYGIVPVGKNTLASCVAVMCKKAGFEGK